MTCVRLAEEPSADPVRAQRRNGSTLAPRLEDRRPSWRLAYAGRARLDLLVSNFARILSSQVALYYQPDSKGQLLPVIFSWGVGPRHERTTRSHSGGIVGRALGAQRAALEPLDHDHESALVESARGIGLIHAVAAPVPVADRTAGVQAAGFSSLPPDRTITTWQTESCAAALGLCLDQSGALDAFPSRAVA